MLRFINLIQIGFILFHTIDSRPEMHPVRWLALTFTTLALSGCASASAATPWPTYTPNPTYTPLSSAALAAAPATSTLAAEAAEAAPQGSPTPLPATATQSAPTPAPLATVELGRRDPREVEVLARVNEWRISVGAWPLYLNPTLKELAQSQAEFLALRGSSLPDDVHSGPDDSLPFDRLRRVGWPTYSNSEQIEGSEVVYIGADATAAVEWWYNSSLHKRTIENPAFREAGIGIANHKWGTVFVILTASQPNHLTALYEPISQQLFIVPETSKYANKGDFFTRPTQMQIVGLPDSPVDPNAWVEYNLTADPPSGLSYFTIVLSDGTHETRVEINTTVDVAWLPESYPQDGVLTGIPTDVLRAAAGGIDATNLDAFYSRDQLTLVNSSTRPIDLRGLVLRAPNGYEMPIDNWAAFMNPSTSLATFPPSHCLIVYPAEIAFPGPLSVCTYVESIINVLQDQAFWRADFELQRNGQTLTTCHPGAGTCSAELPYAP